LICKGILLVQQGNESTTTHDGGSDLDRTVRRKSCGAANRWNRQKNPVGLGRVEFYGR
jgi:hypothetical protein